LRDNQYKLAVLNKSDVEWCEYKKLRNNVVAMIKKAKNDYYNKLLENDKKQPKELWRKLKILLPGNNTQTLEVVFEDGVAYNDPAKISERFNKFFISSIEEIVNGVRQQTFIYQTARFNCDHSISIKFNKFKMIDMKDFKNALATMKNTGGGESGITTSILRDATGVIADRFIDLINSSLMSGVFPEKWKTSIVIPVPKVPKAKKCNEFRPINTVPVYEKLLEIVVKEQLMQHCDMNKIIISEQSEFQKDHSCETAIINMYL
jgi:hypothetical protein